MRVELKTPELAVEPRLWVRHEQGLATLLGPGSIEWGSKRSAMERVDYAPGDLGMCPRHEGHWVGLMTAPHLQISIADGALTAASDGRTAR